MTLLSKICSIARYGKQIPYGLHQNTWPGGGLSTNTFSRSLRRNPSGRKGGMNLAPQYNEYNNGNNTGHKIFKSTVFTFGFCGAAFVGATIWQYETYRSKTQRSDWTSWIKKSWNEMEGFEQKQGEFRKLLNKWWNELNDGEKMFWPLCLINVFVYGCWQNPALQRTMLRFFVSNPAARAVCWPMLLSTFSHYTILHLGMNMYVLNSFSSGVCGTMGREQFLAMYLSAGVVSSYFSHAFKIATRIPGASLGASGAIMGLLGYFCSIYPNAQLGIIFIPGFSFSADTAIKGIMCLDSVGMAMGWRMFDHAAHLGGAVFGIVYAHYGSQYIWGQREIIMKKWHEIRNSITDVIGKNDK